MTRKRLLVILGPLAGSGGTQRLPTLIALPDALGNGFEPFLLWVKLIIISLTGKKVQAKKAKSLGVVDMHSKHGSKRSGKA